MSHLQAPYVSASLARLRRGVTLCCWIVGLSLVAQMLIWAVATFMDVRFQELPDNRPGELIVSGFLATQAASISHHAAAAGLPLVATMRRGKWMAGRAPR